MSHCHIGTFCPTVGTDPHKLGMEIGLLVFYSYMGTRPFWFCTARFFASLAANMILAALVTDILTPDDRR